MWIAENWAEINKGIFALLLPTQWDIRGTEDLRRDRSYLVISNHQSWVDIPALVEALNYKVPYFEYRNYNRPFPRIPAVSGAVSA